MDLGLPWRNTDLPDPILNPYALWVRDALEVAYDQVRCHAGQAVRRQKRLYDKLAVKRVFVIGDWTMRYYPPDIIHRDRGLDYAILSPGEEMQSWTHHGCVLI